jgi:hypothetical protein
MSKPMTPEEVDEHTRKVYFSGKDEPCKHCNGTGVIKPPRDPRHKYVAMREKIKQLNDDIAMFKMIRV